MLIIYGDDDQIVPIADSALLSSKIVKDATLKVYPGAPHGLAQTTAYTDTFNTDLLNFMKGPGRRGRCGTTRQLQQRGNGAAAARRQPTIEEMNGCNSGQLVSNAWDCSRSSPSQSKIPAPCPAVAAHPDRQRPHRPALGQRLTRPEFTSSTGRRHDDHRSDRRHRPRR